MIELRKLLEETGFERYRAVHDCVDTGTSLPISDTVWTVFTCDCLGYEAKNAAIWDKATSTFHNGIDWGIVHFSMQATFTGVQNKYVDARIIIPHPTLGDIVAKQKTFPLTKTTIPSEWSSFVYMGTEADAKTYGFKIELKASDSGIAMTDRSILLYY